jgi:hypothetical protein
MRLLFSKKNQNSAIKRGKLYANRSVQYADCFQEDDSGKFLLAGKAAERLQYCDRCQNRGRFRNLDLPFLA